MIKLRALFFLSAVAILISCNARNQPVDLRQASQSKDSSFTPASADTAETSSAPAPPKTVSGAKPEPKSNTPRTAAVVNKTEKPVIAAKAPEDSVLYDMPEAQLRAIKFIDSLYYKYDRAKNTPGKDEALKQSVAGLYNFVSKDLKLQLVYWEGVVRSVNVLEHAAIEIEIYSPLQLKNSAQAPIKGEVVFLSSVPTSRRYMADAIQELLPGDKVLFTGEIITFNGNEPAIRSYTGNDGDILRRPLVIFDLKDIELIN